MLPILHGEQIEWILKLREESDGAFVTFRKRLSELQPRLQRELEGVSNPDAATRVIADICNEEIGADLKKLREVLKWHNIDAATATIGLPVASASLASLPFAASGHPVIGAVTSGVVALGTVATNLQPGRIRRASSSAASANPRGDLPVGDPRPVGCASIVSVVMSVKPGCLHRQAARERT